MESILVNWVARILLWVIGFYFIIYFFSVFLEYKNLFYAAKIHLFLILLSVMLMTGPPGEFIKGY